MNRYEPTIKILLTSVRYVIIWLLTFVFSTAFVLDDVKISDANAWQMAGLIILPTAACLFSWFFYSAKK
ncbi:hypothetical protein [Roseobacter sp. HKCC-CH-9208]|uniref:hypothetical protein n=1 Tax=Roseobacter sp. HKCC-CH-9208 TaxID=3120339 RepID=UPI0030EB55BA